MYPYQGIRGIPKGGNHLTPNGLTWTAAANETTENIRSGLEITNQDSTAVLWVARRQRGSGTAQFDPTAAVAITDVTYFIPPFETLLVGYNESIDIYIATNSGGAGAINAKADEVSY